MKAISRLYFLVAVALLVGLVQLMRTESGRDARELIAAADRLSTGPEPDNVAALGELNYALRVCQSDGELELIGEVLAKRGLVLFEMHLLAQARTDLETVLAEYQPENTQVEIALISVHIEAGELEEARKRTDDVLARDPTLAEAWTLRSRALVGLADELLDKSGELCRASLPDALTRRAEDLILRASALEFSDPQRAMVVHDLRSLFSAIEEPQSRDVLLILDQATTLVALAREALAESFHGTPLEDSLYDYLRLLHRSGRNELTIAYGMAAVNHRGANRSTAFMGAFMESLLEANRAHAAVEIVNRHFQRGVVPDLDFYEIWCRALHQDERWKPLVFVAENMSNAATNNLVRSLANFYIGTAYIHLEQYYDAPTPLRNFVARDAIEPIPGTRALGWIQLARCYREQEQNGPEKSALRGALALDPEPVDGAAAWQRLAELIMETEPASYSDVERALTHAIRLSPEVDPELLRLWRDQGRQALQATNTEIELVHRELIAAGRLSPDGRGPYELLRHAELHVANDLHAGVVVCCRRILTDYPGFTPALDPLIHAALESGDYASASWALLERLSYGGPDALTLRRIDRLPEDLFTPKLRLQLMELAPEATGRLVLARGLREEGRNLEALIGLTLLDPALLSDPARILIAELAIDLGRNGLAKERLRDIPPASHSYGSALVLQADIAIAEQDNTAQAQLVTEILEREQLDGAALIEVTDRLFLGGDLRRANRLLQALDERADTRNGQVMLRLAQQLWLNDAPQKSHDALVRSEAYMENGGPELGYLMEAVAERRWNDMSRLVASYETAVGSSTVLEHALLDLLAGNLSGAGERIAEGRISDPDEPLWTLLEAAHAVLEFRPLPRHFTGDSADETLYTLSGHGGGERDPRQILVRILALLHPEWRSAAIRDFGRVKVPEQGSLWPTYLAARGRYDLGLTSDAERLVNTILRPWPQFVPGWDLLLKLQADRLQRPNHPRVFTRQQQRFQALGPEPGGRTDDLVRRAYEQLGRGGMDKAMASIEEALERDPTYVRALMFRADLQGKQGLWSEAIASCSTAAAFALPTSDSWVVEEYLEVLEHAMAAAPDLLDSGLVLEQLTTLQARFFDDPLIPLVRAQLDLSSRPGGSAVQLTKALAHLDQFLEQQDDMPLESLRAGSTRAWLAFFIVRDPERAHNFVLGQRALRPESLDLWRMLGETYVALGQRTEAIALYEQLHRMLPDGAAARSLARLYADSGNDDDRVQEFVRYAIRLENVPPRDFGLQLIQARSLINSMTPSARNEGIKILSGLWNRRRRARNDAELAELGELYGLALTWRSNRNDRELAHEVLTTVEPLVTDPARRNVLHALANLALQMRGR